MEVRDGRVPGHIQSVQLRLYWHHILEEIERVANDRCLIRLFRDYFSGRMPSIGSTPKGPGLGLLGRTFYSITSFAPVRVIGYADDALLLIGGNAHQKLEEIAVVCDSLVTGRSTRQKM